MRASDEDRRRAAERLRAAAGEGRLDVTELEERLEAADGARTEEELAELVADLPVPADERLPAPARRRFVAILGDETIDLRGRDLPEDELRATAVLGDVTIMVDPGTRVDLRGMAVLGDRTVDVEPGAANGVLRVQAVAVLGDVTIRSSKPQSWWQRRRQAPPPPEPPRLPG